MSRQHLSTPMMLTVPDGWFDHSVESFQGPDFATTGLALVVRRGSCAGTIDAFVEQDLVESRRAHGEFELLGRTRRQLDGLPVEVAEVRWLHPKGRFHQFYVYGSSEEKRWFRVVVSARAEHAASATKLLEHFFTTARQNKQATA